MRCDGYDYGERVINPNCECDIDWSKWPTEGISRCKKCGTVFDCIHDWEDTGKGYRCKKCLKETAGYEYYCDLCDTYHHVLTIH